MTDLGIEDNVLVLALEQESNKEEELRSQGAGRGPVNTVHGRLVTNAQDGPSYSQSSASTGSKGFSPADFVVQSRFAPLMRTNLNSQRQKVVSKNSAIISSNNSVGSVSSRDTSDSNIINCNKRIWSSKVADTVWDGALALGIQSDGPAEFYSGWVREMEDRDKCGTVKKGTKNVVS